MFLPRLFFFFLQYSLFSLSVVVSVWWYCQIELQLHLPDACKFQVVLPEGSKDISVSVPFPVKEWREVLLYWYLPPNHCFSIPWLGFIFLPCNCCRRRFLTWILLVDLLLFWRRTMLSLSIMSISRYYCCIFNEATRANFVISSHQKHRMHFQFRRSTDCFQGWH